MWPVKKIKERNSFDSNLMQENAVKRKNEMCFKISAYDGDNRVVAGDDILQ